MRKINTEQLINRLIAYNLMVQWSLELETSWVLLYYVLLSLFLMCENVIRKFKNDPKRMLSSILSLFGSYGTSRKNINLQGKHMIAYPRWALLRRKWNSSNYIGVPGITWGCPGWVRVCGHSEYELCFYIRDGVRHYDVCCCSNLSCFWDRCLIFEAP